MKLIKFKIKTIYSFILSNFLLVIFTISFKTKLNLFTKNKILQDNFNKYLPSFEKNVEKIKYNNNIRNLSNMNSNSILKFYKNRSILSKQILIDNFQGISIQSTEISKCRSLELAYFCAFTKMQLFLDVYKDFSDIYLIGVKPASSCKDTHTFIFSGLLNSKELKINSYSNIIQASPLLKIVVPADTRKNTFVSWRCIFEKGKDNYIEDQYCPNQNLPDDNVDFTSN